MIETLDRPEGPARVLTAMITPMDDDRRLLPDNTQTLASWLVANGSDGLVLAGTTGESPALRPEDQLQLFDIVREAVGPDVLLLGGTGANVTDEAIELTAESAERGSIDGHLVVSPYYNKPSQFGIKDYYRKVADHTELPIILYNIPARTGRLVEQDTVRQLIEEQAIDGIKDATGDLEKAARLKQEYGADVKMYSGDDSLNLEFMKIGAEGVIGVATHWAGRETRAMIDAFLSGDPELAERISAALEESCAFESQHTDAFGAFRDTPNPNPTKVLMGHVLGEEAAGSLISPMLVSPEDELYLRLRAPEVLQNLRQKVALLAINGQSDSATAPA